MFSSSLVMSSTLLKIGVRKENEQAEEEGGEWGRVKMGGWCEAEPSQWRMPVIAMFIKLSFSTVVRFIKLSLSTGYIVHQRVILVKCLDRPILSLYEGMVRITIPKKRGHDQCQQNNAKECVIYSLVPHPLASKSDWDPVYLIYS